MQRLRGRALEERQVRGGQGGRTAGQYLAACWLLLSELLGNTLEDLEKICNKYNTKFLVNDDVLLAKKLNADGCHLGQKDMKILEARKILKKKIIGITCHNSVKLAKLAINEKADYLAFGAFNISKTKNTKYKAA